MIYKKINVCLPLYITAIQAQHVDLHTYSFSPSVFGCCFFKFKCCVSAEEKGVDVYADVFIIQDCLQQDTFDTARVNMDDSL